MGTEKEILRNLSEFMDGQIAKDTALFVAKRLADDQGLQQTWSRYHLIRDCIQHKGSACDGSGLSQRVMLQLDMEQETPQAADSRGWSWMRPAVGMAFTLAVAASAIIFVQNGNGPASQPLDDADAALAATPDFVTPSSPVANIAGNQPTPVAGAEERSLGPVQNSTVNPYWLRHNQATQQNRPGSLVFLVPVISGQADSAQDNGERSGTDDEQENPPQQP